MKTLYFFVLLLITLQANCQKKVADENTSRFIPGRIEKNPYSIIQQLRHATKKGVDKNYALNILRKA